MNYICVSLNSHNNHGKHDIFMLQMRRMGLRKIRQLAQGLIAKWRHDSKSRRIYEKEVCIM